MSLARMSIQPVVIVEMPSAANFAESFFRSLRRCGAVRKGLQRDTYANDRFQKRTAEKFSQASKLYSLSADGRKLPNGWECLVAKCSS